MRRDRSRQITSAAGVSDQWRFYLPYGAVSLSTVAVTNPALDTKGWIGERLDADAGLQYRCARYYDPQLGMFLQPDWWEVMQAGVGTNRYSYSFGDPVNGIDPSGPFSCDRQETAAQAHSFSALWAGVFQSVADLRYKGGEVVARGGLEPPTPRL